jgi:cell division transport system permease protein
MSFATRLGGSTDMAPRFDYFFRETFNGLKRNGLIAFATVSTVFIALFLLGGALLAREQASLMIETATANVDVSIFLLDDVSPTQQQQLGRLLNEMPEVESVRYDSKAVAYERFKELFKDQEDLVENTSPDALPASFRVKLHNPEQFAVVKARLTGQPGIDNIVDHSDFLKRLFAVTRVFRIGVLIVAIVMLVAAAVLIGNTVRIAVFNRRKEIGIMRLVGATNWFIRVPFLIEGVLEGLFGAGFAIIALFLMKSLFIDGIGAQLPFLPFIGTEAVTQIVPALLLVGTVVAAIASLIAMRRFLEV